MPYRLYHPKPHNVFQIAEAVCVAAFIGKIFLHALLRANRLHNLRSKQRPGSRTDIETLLFQGRHRQHCGCRVMRCNLHHLALIPHFFRNFFLQIPHYRTRHGKRFENMFREAEHIHQFQVPVIGPDIHQLPCGGIGILALLFPGQYKVKIIRNHQ